jgi:hypothetical protein
MKILSLLLLAASGLWGAAAPRYCITPDGSVPAGSGCVAGKTKSSFNLVQAQVVTDQGWGVPLAAGYYVIMYPKPDGQAYPAQLDVYGAQLVTSASAKVYLEAASDAPINIDCAGGDYGITFLHPYMDAIGNFKTTNCVKGVYSTANSRIEGLTAGGFVMSGITNFSALALTSGNTFKNITVNNAVKGVINNSGGTGNLIDGVEIHYFGSTDSAHAIGVINSDEVKNSLVSGASNNNSSVGHRTAFYLFTATTPGKGDAKVHDSVAWNGGLEEIVNGRGKGYGFQFAGNQATPRVWNVISVANSQNLTWEGGARGFANHVTSVGDVGLLNANNGTAIQLTNSIGLQPSDWYTGGSFNAPQFVASIASPSQVTWWDHNRYWNSTPGQVPHIKIGGVAKTWDEWMAMSWTAAPYYFDAHSKAENPMFPNAGLLQHTSDFPPSCAWATTMDKRQDCIRSAYAPQNAAFWQSANDGIVVDSVITDRGEGFSGTCSATIVVADATKDYGEGATATCAFTPAGTLDSIRIGLPGDQYRVDIPASIVIAGSGGAPVRAAVATVRVLPSSIGGVNMSLKGPAIVAAAMQVAF